MLVSPDFEDIKDKNFTLKKSLNKSINCCFHLLIEGKLRMLRTFNPKILSFGTKTIWNITLSPLGNACLLGF